MDGAVDPTALHATLLRPLVGLWVVWIALCVVWMPRDRWLAALALAAAGVRLVVARPVSALPDGKGWWLSNLAAGSNPSPGWSAGRYGDAWESAGVLVRTLSAGLLDPAPWVALLGSVVAVPAVVVAAERMGASRPLARAGGAVLAVLPAAVVSSMTISRFSIAVPLAIVGLATVLPPADGEDRSSVDLALAVVSAGLLAHARPLLVPAALVLLVAAWDRRRAGPWALGALVVAWRVVSGVLSAAEGALPGDPPALGALKVDRALVHWSTPSDWVGGMVLLDPTVFPLGVTVLAIGAWAAGRSARAVAIGWAVLGALVVPYAHFGFRFDLYRMQLPAMAVGVGLAAVGAQVALDRLGDRRVIGGALGVLVVASMAWAGSPRGQPAWSWIAEEALFRDGLRGLDPEQPLVVGPVLAQWDLAQWTQRQGVREVRSPPAVGAARFVGIDAFREGTPDLSGWAPHTVRTIRVYSDGWYGDLEGQTVTIGWYRPEGKAP